MLQLIPDDILRAILGFMPMGPCGAIDMGRLATVGEYSDPEHTFFPLRVSLPPCGGMMPNRMGIPPMYMAGAQLCLATYATVFYGLRRVNRRLLMLCRGLVKGYDVIKTLYMTYHVRYIARLTYHVPNEERLLAILNGAYTHLQSNMNRHGVILLNHIDHLIITRAIRDEPRRYRMVGGIVTTDAANTLHTIRDMLPSVMVI